MCAGLVSRLSTLGSHLIHQVASLLSIDVYTSHAEEAGILSDITKRLSSSGFESYEHLINVLASRLEWPPNYPKEALNNAGYPCT